MTFRTTPPDDRPPVKIRFAWIAESYQIYRQARGVWIGGIAVYGAVMVLLCLPAVNVTNSISSALGEIDFGDVLDGSVKLPPIDDFVVPLATYGLCLLLLIVVALFSSAALYRLAVMQVRQEPVSFADAFRGGEDAGMMLVYVTLAGLLNLVGGSVFCFGAYYTAGLTLPGYAMVSDGWPPFDAFKVSTRVMSADSKQVGFFMVAASFVPLPMFHIISALAYRDMVGFRDRNN